MIQYLFFVHKADTVLFQCDVCVTDLYDDRDVALSECSDQLAVENLLLFLYGDNCAARAFLQCRLMTELKTVAHGGW